MSKLHPEAVVAWDAKIASLVSAIRPMPLRQSAPSVPPEKSDTHVSAHLTDKNIRLDGYREYRNDRSGKRTACYFYVEGRGLVGIDGDAHHTLLTISDRIAAAPAYRAAVTADFVYRQLVKWLQLSVAREQTSSSACGFFESEAAAAIKKAEIWVPVPVAQITRPLQIGNVTFRRITKPMMDAYAERTGAYTTPEGAATFNRIRQRIQATTAATLVIEAEPSKAEEIAALEVESAIGIFRLACPVLLDARQWAPIDPSFVDGFGGGVFLTVEGGTITGYHSYLPPDMCGQWLMQPGDMDRNLRLIWAFGHNLLVIHRNEFQELLLGALLQYSKSLLKADLSERLLYVVSALEALCVRESEPIVQNLRERLAVMHGSTIGERLKAADTITKVYDLRSRFVHRATKVADLSLVADFFFEAWTTMFLVLNNYNKWRTKSDFLAYVDSYKFRGPVFNTSDLPPLAAG